jgi:DNA-binding transcriptional regulator GbsR (MarR family)
MKVLYTIKEYAKLKGLTEIAIRKKLSSNYNEFIKIGKDTYIIEDDTVVQKLKQNIKNKNSQIRELKLKLSIQNDNTKYIQELEKDKKRLLKELKQERKYNKKIHRDIFATLANQNKLLN